jgi:hypothetical protein
MLGAVFIQPVYVTHNFSRRFPMQFACMTEGRNQLRLAPATVRFLKNTMALTNGHPSGISGL